MGTNLSEHFTLEEATASLIAASRGIDNTPSAEIVTSMKNTAAHMEKLRVMLRSPIDVSSWYRSPALNKAARGVRISQHCKGEAVDFLCPGYGTPLAICKFIATNKFILRFDQLILEHTWVHISFCSDPNATPRNEVLSLLASKKYAHGLTDPNGNPYE